MRVPPPSAPESQGPYPSDMGPNAGALTRFAAIKDLALHMYKEEDPSKRQHMLNTINRDLDEILLLIEPNPSRLEDIQLIRNTASSACFGSDASARKLDYIYLCKSLDTVTADL